VEKIVARLEEDATWPVKGKTWLDEAVMESPGEADKMGQGLSSVEVPP
jgi:hypothetical protein